jgi:hypothetical protein
MITKLLLALVIITFLICPVIGASANTTITAYIIEPHHYSYSGSTSRSYTQYIETSVPTTIFTTVPTTQTTTQLTTIPTTTVITTFPTHSEKIPEHFPDEQTGFNWWWIILLIILVVLGVVAYTYYKHTTNI